MFRINMFINNLSFFTLRRPNFKLMYRNGIFCLSELHRNLFICICVEHFYLKLSRFIFLVACKST